LEINGNEKCLIEGDIQMGKSLEKIKLDFCHGLIMIGFELRFLIGSLRSGFIAKTQRSRQQLRSRGEVP
jgi:hypothetical protein